MYTAGILKIPRPTVQNCCNEEKDAAANVINSRSDTESEIRYSCLIFGENKIKLICLST